MSYGTDLIGHIEISPPLNRQEQDYLRVFAASRRHRRRGGPYAVPASLRGDDDQISADPVAHSTPGEGQPGFWCQWVASCSGRCIAHNGGDHVDAPTEWLRYVIDHFLRPHAHAAAAPRVEFNGFTFDHVCNGIVAARHRDTAKRFLISVSDNSVTEQTLVDGTPGRVSWGALDFAAELDRRPSAGAGPRRSTAYPSTVVPFRPATKGDR
jgi:hypothetical protein